MSLAVCADVGSTWTKVAVVDPDTGRLAATAAHRTTVDSDVLRGLDAAVAAAAARLPGRDLGEVLVCSSAGGGLRLAVVGYEALVSAEAGHRVALSAGARVVHVAAGRLAGPDVAALRASRPDVVLLVGGTDGGDADVLTHNARRLAAARLRVPVVVAGNADARDEVLDALRAARVPVVAAANVLPRIGDLRPGPARAAIRDVFLRHVIGGKGLSRGPRFGRLVRAATPDAVLTAVELLADAGDTDLLVVDVGGATTDVYSALRPGESGEVAGTLWRARTVEGDLGVRWSAPGVLAAARAEKLLDGSADLDAAAARRAADPGFVATTHAERAVDARLATLAATVAVRRHARGEPVGSGGPDARTGPRRGGRDLAAVGLVVGSGGVLRHAPDGGARVVLAAVAGGWRPPRAPAVRVDAAYVLAAAGLLADAHRAAALALLRSQLHRG